MSLSAVHLQLHLSFFYTVAKLGVNKKGIHPRCQLRGFRIAPHFAVSALWQYTHTGNSWIRLLPPPFHPFSPAGFALGTNSACYTTVSILSHAVSWQSVSKLHWMKGSCGHTCSEGVGWYCFSKPSSVGRVLVFIRKGSLTPVGVAAAPYLYAGISSIPCFVCTFPSKLPPTLAVLSSLSQGLTLPLFVWCFLLWINSKICDEYSVVNWLIPLILTIKQKSNITSIKHNHIVLYILPEFLPYDLIQWPLDKQFFWLPANVGGGSFVIEKTVPGSKTEGF